MTRINCIYPSALSDKHLLAAWKEYPRIITAVGKLVEKGIKVEDVDIPENYTFGTGHCKFFYNKLGWLKCMLFEVYIEMRNRDMNPNVEIYYNFRARYHELDSSWKTEWSPTVEDRYLNMARLVERYFKTNMKVEGRKVVEEATIV